MTTKEQKSVILTCGQCNKSFKIKLPENKKLFNVKCPHCEVVSKVVLNPKDIKLGNCEQPHAEVQEADNENNSTGNIVCPDCKKSTNYIPKKNGKTEGFCPHCNASLIIEVIDLKVVKVTKKPTHELKQQWQGGGVLTIVRHKWYGKIEKQSFPLRLGRNTVGRYDRELDSDISIRDDDYMSRRSIVIDVVSKEKGRLYKLIVLNAVNPVLHNNKQLNVGESIYLNYGDTIKLGNTIFIFEQV